MKCSLPQKLQSMCLGVVAIGPVILERLFTWRASVIVLLKLAMTLAKVSDLMCISLDDAVAVAVTGTLAGK